ncbi:MAG: polysaccharide biosynthesis tyrosine autokinase [Idiomarina sp.]|nr:polysaccharide biosynthesis tyrosine autokinase [Idiomarina sp.]
MSESQSKSMNGKQMNRKEDDEIDLGRMIGVLLDFKWWIIGCTLAAGIIGSIYAALQPPIYRADALVQLEGRGGSMPGLQEFGSMFEDNSSAQAEIQIIRSRMIAGAVVDKLGLEVRATPKRFPYIGEYFARNHRGQEPAPAKIFTSYAWGGEQINVSEMRVTGSLMGRPLTLVAQERSGEQTAYEIHLEDDVLVQGVTGELAEAETVYGSIAIRISELVARPGTEFTVQRIPRLAAMNSVRGPIEVIEQGQRTGMLVVQMTGQDRQRIHRVLDAVVEEYLMQNIRRNAAQVERSQEFIEEQLPRLQGELQTAEDDLNQFRMTNQTIDIQFDTQRVLEQLVDIERRINELSVRESELSRLYTRNHPTYTALIEQRERLEQERDMLRGEIQELPEAQQQILRLTRDVEVTQQIYLALLNRNQEMSIMRAGTVGNVRIIDEATVTPGPIGPRRGVIRVMFVVFGAFVGLGIAVVFGMLRSGIKTPKELEDIGISVYASIPLSQHQLKVEERIRNAMKFSRKKANKQKFNTLLLARDHPEDLAIEALRSLRTSLHFAMLEAKNNVVMISGPSPEVGKTFVTSNLAVVLAQTGMKVLIIDADMRRGYVHTTFNLPNDHGLADVLSARNTIEEGVQKSDIEGLDFMSRGTVPPNPSELLMHKNFENLVSWASEKYDIVLIDTPPILAVTDPGIVGRYAGTSLVVARFMRNQLKEVEYTIERFDKVGVEIKGVILNGIERTASSSYGYGSYGYYAYGYASTDR